VSLRHRHEYAADLPRSLPSGTCHPPQEFPNRCRMGAHRFQPISTRFELAPNQGTVKRRFLAYSSPSRLPDPNHLAVLARPVVVGAAPTLPGTTRIRLPPAPPPLLRQGRRCTSPTSTRTNSASRRTYDLRHGAVSLWLNAGISPAEVAARAGHSAHVLLKVYAKCIDGEARLVNARIEAALGTPAAEPERPDATPAEGDIETGNEGTDEDMTDGQTGETATP